MGNVNGRDGVEGEDSGSVGMDGSAPQTSHHASNDAPDTRLASASANGPAHYQLIPGQRLYGNPSYNNGGRDAYLGSSDHMSITPAGSPGSSTRSPPMNTPQTPIAPFYQVDEPGRSWAPEWEGHDDREEELSIGTLIEWSHGGNDVSVEGSWDDWSTRIPLHRAGRNFTLVKFLPLGVYHYRFIVNGERRHSPDLPYMYDDLGNASNILDVQDYVPENLDGVGGFEPPASPESSYDNSLPGPEDYTKDPPLLPSQLHLTTLNLTPNSNASDDISVRPQHVILNHLFLETGKAACPVVALGFTQRFRSKYVTVIMHKPLQR